MILVVFYKCNINLLNKICLNSIIIKNKTQKVHKINCSKNNFSFFLLFCNFDLFKNKNAITEKEKFLFITNHLKKSSWSSLTSMTGYSFYTSHCPILFYCKDLFFWNKVQAIHNFILSASWSNK